MLKFINIILKIELHIVIKSIVFCKQPTFRRRLQSNVCALQPSVRDVFRKRDKLSLVCRWVLNQRVINDLRGV